MDLFNHIKEDARRFFLNARGSHDWSHIERVHNLCLHIGEKEGADVEILAIAAILHDIGRGYEDKSSGEICHAEKGAELAKGLLRKYNLSSEKIDKIIHCIETHRFRGNKIPKTKEAKILFDADKLDSIGAVGVGRAFLFAGEIGSALHNKNVAIEDTIAYTKEDTAFREFTVKLKKIKNKMLTEEGKRIAENRHSFMVDFFDRLNKEADGIL